MSNKEHIEAIIDRTFKIVQSVYDNQQEKSNGLLSDNEPKSRIIFPKYRKGTTRFSEQELRFIFVEQLNIAISQGWNVYYSVETPTSKKYKFKGVDNPMVFSDDSKEGQSAQFDLVIHDEHFQRIALIEFKANNASVEHHAKDFKKLTEEGTEGILTYFLEIVKSSDSGTSKNLSEKIIDFNGIFRCWSCSEKNYII